MRKFLLVLVILLVLGTIVYAFLPRIILAVLPADNRPAEVPHPSAKLTPEEFSRTALELAGRDGAEFPHIARFRQAGILEYEGPSTCLGCHEEITVQDSRTGKTKRVDLMKNLLGSAHYRFYTKDHPNVYGFNGRLADHFAMGKIDRPCPKPGSFAMTAWAELVVTDQGTTYSEGCGQCHIGGQTQAPLGEMMPGYRTTEAEKEAIDCLICHAQAYDMNQKQVAKAADGRLYWQQDRSLRAALSVRRPSSQNCLRCHQHNLGGDIYIDENDPSFMQSMTESGKERPRVKHPGSKRGVPFSPSWDVHAAAGLACIDCHVTEGHLIAKGTHTTTMMANDLPQTEVSCETCHTAAPHRADAEWADMYNEHTAKIACVTCHIPSLHPDNATYRDFAEPEREPSGLYIYTDIAKETQPGKGIQYAWWNGDATFLGNPIGDNPNGKNLYRFYDPQHIWPKFASYDYAGWYERVMRPLAKKGRPSKLYAMKLFNGRQHIDLQNMGPFGGMYLPYNLPVYYTGGDPAKAAVKEEEKSMMRMMYGGLFKLYMMNRFMSYMDIDRWNTSAYADLVAGRKSEARWIPNDALLEISHAVRRTGALACQSCHSPNGVLDWIKLGYPKDEAVSLAEPRF
jgi:hypothetical protein